MDAVEQGKLSESLVRERVKPLFYTRMRLGQFDPPEKNPFSKLSNKDVVTPDHLAKAVEVAKKSFVLLKNNNSMLPLNPADFKKVAVRNFFVQCDLFKRAIYLHMHYDCFFLNVIRTDNFASKRRKDFSLMLYICYSQTIEDQ